MAHKFTYTYPDSEISVIVEVDKDAHIDTMIEAFTLYLQGCGYNFDGKIILDQEGEY